jgi:class 3 adenylate cyclase
VGLAEDIKSEVGKIFREKWEVKSGLVVPTTEDIGLDNKGVELDAVILYADMADSTKLVMNYTSQFAAEVYKAFLKTSCRIIRDQGGTITAFDGDRVMAVFIGDLKNTSAAKAAFKINYAIENIVNPEMKKIYTNTVFSTEYSIGIDSSKILVARTGIRGANDLVWVGNAANLAAKLCGLRDGRQKTWITERVFKKLRNEMLYGGDPERLMWNSHDWRDFGIKVYSSSWHWEF